MVSALTKRGDDGLVAGMTEWNASGYEQVSALQKMLADDALASLKLAGTEQILDIGCGDGRITAEVAKRVTRGSVLGVDPSRNMIEYAQQRFKPTEYPNLKFAMGDARTLNYRAEFDLVISFNALHWVHEQETALRGIRAALKPGGRTLLRFVCQGPRKNIEAVNEETALSPRWVKFFVNRRAPFLHFTPEGYRALLPGAGLKELSMNLMDSAWDFKTRKGFTTWANVTFVPWTQYLPKEETAAFIADSLDHYARVAGDEHTFKYYQLTVVTASKA